MIMRLNVEERIERGKPKTKWLDTVEKDMRAADVRLAIFIFLSIAIVL